MKKKTIITYLVFAFALAWIVWGILALLGVDLSSPLAGVVLPISMFAPAAAVLIRMYRVHRAAVASTVLLLLRAELSLRILRKAMP